MNGNGHKTPDLSCLELDSEDVHTHIQDSILPHLSKGERADAESRIERIVWGFGISGIDAFSLLQELAEVHQFGKGSRFLGQYVEYLASVTTPESRCDMNNPHMIRAGAYLSDLRTSLVEPRKVKGVKPIIEYGNLAYGIRE